MQKSWIESPSDAVPSSARSSHRTRKILSAGDQEVVIYQIYYDAESAAALDPDYNAYSNVDLTKFMENSVIASLLEAGVHRGCDYFGVISWRFHRKVPLSKVELLRGVANGGGKADVYSFFGHPEIQGSLFWVEAEGYHPGIISVGEEVLRRLGYSLSLRDLRAPVIYGNYFLGRPEIYEQYYREMLKPALSLMENPMELELSEILHRDSSYSVRSSTAMTLAQKQNVFGRPYFTYHPFICERLFSTWLASRPDIVVEHLWDKTLPHRSQKQAAN